MWRVFWYPPLAQRISKERRPARHDAVECNAVQRNVMPHFGTESTTRGMDFAMNESCDVIRYGWFARVGHTQIDRQTDRQINQPTNPQPTSRHAFDCRPRAYSVPVRSSIGTSGVLSDRCYGARFGIRWCGPIPTGQRATKTTVRKVFDPTLSIVPFRSVRNQNETKPNQNETKTTHSSTESNPLRVN